MTESLLRKVAGAVGRELGWLRIDVPGDGPDPAWSLLDVLARQRQGEDPTAPWRVSAEAGMARMNGVPIPPSVTGAFVLQWLLEIPATVGAYTAALGPWVPDLGALGWDLSPAGHAGRIVLGPVEVVDLEVHDRLEAVEASYRVVAEPLADSFSSEAKTSSQQRHGMVTDVWEMAEAKALGSGEVVARQSCCFIYVLPGMHECAGCPRLRSQP